MIRNCFMWVFGATLWWRSPFCLPKCHTCYTQHYDDNKIELFYIYNNDRLALPFIFIVFCVRLDVCVHNGALDNGRSDQTILKCIRFISCTSPASQFERSHSKKTQKQNQNSLNLKRSIRNLCLCDFEKNIQIQNAQRRILPKINLKQQKSVLTNNFIKVPIQRETSKTL